ncbi:MAG: rRNA pseudouridine synthase [bacterium]|nr:rRNA pseudouridine synthase [bacterium]
MPTSKLIRLHVFLAHAGLASRRKAEEFISQGVVRVNGKVAEIGQVIDPKVDKVSYRGSVVSKQSAEYFYIAVNKPVGYVSTTSDELGRKTVLDLLPPKYKDKNIRLYPVGRLDTDSQGLLLLTNDGDLAYSLTHPKFEVAKTYRVLLDRQPSEKAISQLQKGVRLKEGYTAPAEVEPDPGKSSWVTMTIHEGKKRQIRRMMERVGYDVIQLIRTNLGVLSLDDLQQRSYLVLSGDMLEAVKQSVTR